MKTPKHQNTKHQNTMKTKIINELLNDLNNRVGENILIITPFMGGRVVFKSARLNVLDSSTIMLDKEGDEYVALNLAHLTRYDLENGQLFLYFNTDKAKTIL